MALVRVSDPRRGVMPPTAYARRRAAFANANAILARGRGLRGLGGPPAFVTGIPDSPTCGANPCGWTDAIRFPGTGPASAQCISFVRCADPSDFSSWLAGGGALLASLGAQVGTDVGGTVGGTVDSTIDSAVTAAFGPTAATGSGVNWLVVGGILAAVLLVPRLLKA